MTKLFQHIKIQTNNRCTRRCSYCYYGHCDQPENIELSAELFKKIVDNLADLGFKGRIGYFETNEPLTDPRLFEFINYSKQKNPDAWHMIASNGDLLDLDKLDRLFAAGLSELKVSTYDDATFAKISNFKKSRDYLIEIIDQRQPFLLDNRGGNISHEGAAKPQQALQAGCDRIHNVLCVRPSGKIVSCCCDFYEINCFGNVKDNRLEDIWTNVAFESFRQSIDNLDRTVSPLCNQCNYGGSGGFFNFATK